NDPTMFGAGGVAVAPQFATPTSTTTNVFNIVFRGDLANANFNQLSTTVIDALPSAANFVSVSTAFEGTGNEVQTVTFGNRSGVSELQKITKFANAATAFT